MQLENTLAAVKEHPEDSGTQINGLYCISELVTANECQLIEGFHGEGTRNACPTCICLCGTCVCFFGLSCRWATRVNVGAFSFLAFFVFSSC